MWCLERDLWCVIYTQIGPYDKSYYYRLPKTNTPLGSFHIHMHSVCKYLWDLENKRENIEQGEIIVKALLHLDHFTGLWNTVSTIYWYWQQVSITLYWSNISVVQLWRGLVYISFVQKNKMRYKLHKLVKSSPIDNVIRACTVQQNKSQLSTERNVWRYQRVKIHLLCKSIVKTLHYF